LLAQRGIYRCLVITRTISRNLWITEHRIFVFAAKAAFEEIQEYRVDSVKRERVKQKAKAEHIPTGRVICWKRAPALEHL
jgi:hypothetical protein